MKKMNAVALNGEATAKKPTIGLVQNGTVSESLEQ